MVKPTAEGCQGFDTASFKIYDVCVCAIYPILNVPPRPPYLFRPGIGNETCTLSRANF